MYLIQDVWELLKRALRARTVTDLRILWDMTAWRVRYRVAPVYRVACWVARNGRALLRMNIRDVPSACILWPAVLVTAYATRRVEYETDVLKRWVGFEAAATEEAERIRALLPNTWRESVPWAYAYMAGHVGREQYVCTFRRRARWLRLADAANRIALPIARKAIARAEARIANA